MSEVSAAGGHAGAARAAGKAGGMLARGGVRPSAVASLPTEPGVYRFRDRRDRVLYVGRAVNLRRRVASYWGDLGSRGHLAPMVARIARVQALVCDSEHEAAWLERNLLETSLPPWNRTPGGQESAVFIRLDTGPVTPGLAVTFRADPADRMRYFGPYLGGLRVRHAVCALNRLLPLPYTVARLGGAEHDLARARGVAGGDRMALIGSLTAILDRQPAAVSWATSHLERLRDRAASALAYEFAARVQAEIEALGWISSPQRVTSLDAANLTISGWSAGILTNSGSAMAGSAAGRSGHAAWPAPPPRWPPPRRPGETSPSATPNWPRAWLSLHSTTRTKRHTPRPGSGHAEHPFRCVIHRQATDHDHSADRRQCAPRLIRMLITQRESRRCRGVRQVDRDADESTR